MAYLIKVKLTNGNEVVTGRADIDDCFKWYQDKVQSYYGHRVKKITIKFIIDAPADEPDAYKFGD
jgi:hypothetical protein